MNSDKKTIIVNNEEIEILDLSAIEPQKKEEKPKLSEKQKKILKFAIPSICVTLIIFIGLIYILNKPTKEITYKNEIKKQEKIKTTLDLEGIFISDENDENITTKAVIQGEKIYYTYSPYYCEDSENIVPTCKSIEELKSNCKKEQKNTCKNNSNSIECEENYCEEKYDNEDCTTNDEIKYKNDTLCENYYTNIDDKKTLNKRYIISSNLDGTKMNIIEEYGENNLVTFDYKNTSLALFHIDFDNEVYSLDFKNDKITKIKSNTKILSYPLLPGNKFALVEENGENYKLNIYNDNDLSKKPKTIKVYNNDRENLDVRLDKYEENTYYTMSNEDYDESLENGYNGLYKNGKLIYSFKNTYKDFFIGGNNIIILTTNGYNIRILKIDKTTYEEKGAKIILKSNKQINNVSFITYGNDNLIYLMIDDEIYTYNEADDTLTKLKITFNQIKDYSTYNNFIYFYEKTNNNLNTLHFYNTETKEIYEIKNVIYYTLNEGKLYTVEKIDDTLQLYSYNIN